MKKPAVQSGQGKKPSPTRYHKAFVRLAQHYGLRSPKHLPRDGADLLRMWWTLDPENPPVTAPSRAGYERLAERLHHALHGKPYFFTLELEEGHHGDHRRIYDSRTVRRCLRVLTAWVGREPAYVKLEVGTSGGLHAHAIGPKGLRLQKLPAPARVTYCAPCWDIGESVAYLVKAGDGRRKPANRYERPRLWRQGLEDWMACTLDNERNRRRKPTLSKVLNLPNCAAALDHEHLTTAPDEENPPEVFCTKGVAA